MNNKTIIEFGFRIIWGIMEIEVGVIRLGLRPHSLILKLSLLEIRESPLAPRFASNNNNKNNNNNNYYYYYLLLLLLFMMMMMILWVVNKLRHFIRVRICFQGGTLVATVVTLEKGLLWLVQAQLLLCATLAYGYGYSNVICATGLLGK